MQSDKDTARFKPECQLSGTDGNIFSLVGKAGRALKDADMLKERNEMQHRVMGAKSYNEALSIIMEYVDAY